MKLYLIFTWESLISENLFLLTMTHFLIFIAQGSCFLAKVYFHEMANELPALPEAAQSRLRFSLTELRAEVETKEDLWPGSKVQSTEDSCWVVECWLFLKGDLLRFEGDYSDEFWRWLLPLFLWKKLVGRWNFLLEWSLFMGHANFWYCILWGWGWVQGSLPICWWMQILRESPFRTLFVGVSI